MSIAQYPIHLKLQSRASFSFCQMEAISTHRPYLFIKHMGAQITHWGRVTHVCVGKLAIIDSGNGLSPGWRQTIIWINARNITNWTLRNKLQWNFNTNSHIVIQENGFISEMAVILARPQCVDMHVWSIIWTNDSLFTDAYMRHSAWKS